MNEKPETSANISETESERVLSDHDLKASCFAYARSNFQGHKFLNKNTDEEIIVSKDGLGEWKSKSRSREQILSIKILNKLLENGILDHEGPDKLSRKNIESIGYYNSPCIINGTEYNAVITVRHIKNYGKKYYHHYLEDINIGPRSGITRPAGETG
jgi:hypothetical protein